jgi:hypothetical protein
MARFPGNWTVSTPGTNQRTTIGIGLVELSGCSFVQSPGNRRKYRFSRAPHRRQKKSAAKAARTDGMFYAHLAYPHPRKRKATRACEEGRVGGSHQSCERSVQDVYGECYTASILVLTGFFDGPNER